jgi:acyl carrier protein
MPGQTTTHLRTLFTETFSAELPAPHTDLLDEGVLDPLQFAELLDRIEARFGLRIDPSEQDLDGTCTLERLAGIIAHRGAPTGAAFGADFA